MSEVLNLDRKPTALDRKILEYLENGGMLSHVDVLNKFKSTQSRDHFWRLRKAGHKIKDKMVYYFTAEGQKKRYKVYYLFEPLFVGTGEKVEKPYKKDSEIPVESEMKPVETLKYQKRTQATLFY